MIKRIWRYLMGYDLPATFTTEQLQREEQWQRAIR